MIRTNITLLHSVHPPKKCNYSSKDIKNVDDENYANQCDAVRKKNNGFINKSKLKWDETKDKHSRAVTAVGMKVDGTWRL